MAEFSEDGAHAHLAAQCPWYAAVGNGDSATEPDSMCRGRDTSGALRQHGGALVKFTPRTQEASTVDQPTVPPGGPGLFHIKGRHLPPYVQHLYQHLVARYGKEKAYGVAVGVVKKWAAGTAPGGRKGGKPRHTHPDVRAAAQRNVALWEKDRADAHQQSREHEHTVKATLALSVAGEPFPGSELLPVTPVPGFPAARQMFTAHRVNQLIYRLTHAQERISAARREKDPGQRDYHIRHVANHLGESIKTARQLSDNLWDNYPAESRELDALGKVMQLARALTPDAKASTTAHLLQTVSYDLAHAKRHADAMVARPGTPELWGFNCDHAEKHVGGALSHSYKLAEHLHDNYPAESRWLAKLEKHQSPAAPARPHAVKLAAPAAQPKGSPLPRSADRSVISAPGTRLQAPATTVSAQLKHVPSQTVSPSPPLPPGVEIPTEAECLAAAKDLQADAPSDSDLLKGAVRQLEDAGRKLARKEPVHALQSLRGAQMGILAAHYELRRNDIPVANVFTAARVPPAEAASAHAAMAQSVKDRERFRKHYMTVSKMIDRIRRGYFHGQYGGWANARFSVEGDDSYKLPHTQVHYRDGDRDKHCGNCYMYENEHCSLVADPIGEHGLCDRWLPVPVESSDRQVLEQIILSQAREVD